MFASRAAAGLAVCAGLLAVFSGGADARGSGSAATAVIQVPPQCVQGPGDLATCTFTAAGDYSLTLPPGATDLAIQAYGAQGGGSLGGLGASASASGGPVPFVQTLAITVGGLGRPGTSPGGGGGPGSGQTNTAWGGGGGSFVSGPVFAGGPTVPLVIAGGGGGSVAGLVAGGNAGSAGSTGGAGGDAAAGGAGVGATDGAGGAGGTNVFSQSNMCGPAVNPGKAGTAGSGENGGTGGNAGTETTDYESYGGGGGGGGYAGGGGGGGGALCIDGSSGIQHVHRHYGGGGGGGSSYVNPAAGFTTSSILDGSNATQTGDGEVVITFNGDVTPPTATFASSGSSRYAPFVFGFSEPVEGVSAADLTITPDLSSTPLSGSIACFDAGNAAVDCATGSVSTAQFTPSTPLVLGQYYNAALNGGPGAITDLFENQLVPVTLQARAGTSIPATDPRIHFQWAKVKNANALGKSYTEEKWPGATATYKFTGSTISLYTMEGPAEGKARVRITNPGGATIQNTIDLYAASTIFGPITWGGLTPGPHTLTVKVLGTKRAASTDTWVPLDAVQVDGGVPTLTPNFTYKWPSLPDGSGGTYYYSSAAGASFTVAFRGAGIGWSALVGPNNGNAVASIDGTAVASANLYAPSYYFASIPIPAVMDGVHTLKVTVTGTKDPASSDTVVSVDGVTAN